MFKSLKVKAVFVTLLVAGAIFLSFPPKDKIHLGLDLQGGIHLLLKVDITGMPVKEAQGAAERAIEIIRNRVDQLGVKEPSIQRQGEYNIIVQLPGITDRKRAIDLIGKTALLEFKLVSDDQQLLNQAIAGTIPEGYELKYDENETPLLLEKETLLTGAALKDAQVGFGEYALPEIDFKLNKEGARKFARLTAANIGRRLAIVLDGVVQSAPTIQSMITDSGRITGKFDNEQASDLAIVLRAGALPAPIIVEEDRTIGANLGEDSINSGVKAAIIGAIAVAIFMAIYYLLSGLIANFALCLNLIILMGALAIFKASLTLPGIAGIALTLGMAVDANVLILERIREELKTGKTIRQSIPLGYKRAFLTIFDSNFTTIITAMILFAFGSGPVRGFAVTLTIGLVISMFTSVYVTRLVYDFLMQKKDFTKLKMLQFIGVPKINFVGMRKIAYLFSVVLLIAGMVIFFQRGQKNFGIDFTGGTLQQYKFEKSVSIDKIRTALKEIGLGNSTIQQFGGNKEVIVRTMDDTSDKITNKLEETFKDNKFEIMRVERVGPVASQKLVKQAVYAVLWGVLAIAIYVAYRFELAFSAGAAISLFHDVLMTLGFLALTGREISLTVVAALLTIIGYSINDTIVTFDRIRENLKLPHKLDFKGIVNLSVNQTLSRTILTSLTVYLVLIAMFFFGGEVINDFAFTLLVGLFFGTYSSIFIAAAIVVDWPGKHRFFRK